VRDGRIDYPTAVKHHLFRPLGTGDGEVAGVVQALRTVDYRGWYGLEADTRVESVEDDPLDDVRASLHYLRSLLPA
jgi:inosose dehydratase